MLAAFLIGAFISIGAFFISNYTTFFSLLPRNSDPSPAIASLCLSILLFVVTERGGYILSLRRTSKDIATVRDYFEVIKSTLDRRAFIEWIGSPDQALVHFMRSRKNVKCVYNTHIKTRVASTAIPPQEQLYDKTVRDEFHSFVRKLIGNNKVQWHDIIVNMDAKRREFADWAKSTPNRRYYVHYTNFTSPFVNYMLIQYNDGTSSVYFGWSYSHDNPAVGDVFFSTDNRICEYFNLFTQHIIGHFCKDVDDKL